MIQPAVPDIIGPSVAAEDPHTGLGEQITHRGDLRQQGVLALLFVEQLTHGIARGLAGIAVIHGLEPRTHRGLKFRGDVAFHRLPHQVGQTLTPLCKGDIEPIPELGIVFEQAVGPGRPVALGIHGIRTTRHRPAIDTRAPRGHWPRPSGRRTTA